MIDSIKQGWHWSGLEPVEILIENKFGNLVVRDVDNKFWRICPEEAELTLLADNLTQLNALWHDEDFRIDWLMPALVQQAEQAYGELAEGKKFCLKIPGVLGGDYAVENIGVITFDELIRFSGHLAQQLHGLPDGSKVDFSFAR